MALNDRVNPWIGDQRRRVVAAQEEAIIDEPICHDPVGETDEQKLGRQKRREAIGQRYLAGRGAPFILSAQLKGPFDKASGWKNPWLLKESSPEEAPAPKENARSLALKKALRDQPSLTGRQRNGSVSSVAFTRSHISIGSNPQSQGMAIDRPAIVRQPAAKPNLHGGLKHFLGAVSGGTPASTRKLDRDNLPAQLPPLKRKADISWLKGADIVKKKRRELPDLPSPTPPNRVNSLNSHDGRQFVTPTNLLDKFRQHSQGGIGQDTETPTNKRPAITSSQSQSQPYVDIPTPSQEYAQPFKRQRRSLLAAPNPDAGPTEKKVFAKSRLSQANRRSTSNASTLTDHALNEEPVKPLAKRVMSLNRAEEVYGNGSFKFRRTKRVEDVNAMETVVSSIERDDDKIDVKFTVANEEVERASEDESDGLETQPVKKHVPVKPVVEKSTIGKLVAKLKSVENVAVEHVDGRMDAPVSKAPSVVSERRERNSRSLPSDSETESPEKARLPLPEEQKILSSGIAIAPDESKEPALPTSSSKATEASIVDEEPTSSGEESRIQIRQHRLTTIQEVTKTTSSHVVLSEPTAQTCTTATESLVMDVVQDEMLHDDEADTSMPDSPPSSDDKHDLQQEPVAVIVAEAEKAADEVAEEVSETTYVQMASGSISTGSAPHVSQPNVSQSTAMNTQAIDALKANLLEEEDEDEDMMEPAPESTSSPEEAANKMPEEEAEESSAQSQYAQRDQATPRPQSNNVAGNATREDELSSEPTFYSERKQTGRPQIRSSEQTNSTPSTMASQPHITVAGHGTSQQSIIAVPTVDEEDESSEPSQYAQRQRPNVQISESEPTNTGTIRSDSQYAAPPAPGSSSQPGNAAEPTVDDILRILRSSQRRDVDSSHEKTPTQKSQDHGNAAAGGDVISQMQSFNWHAEPTQDETSKIASSPPRSQVYSQSPIKSLQVGALVQSQFQSQPHLHHSSQPPAHAVSGEDSSMPANTENTGTTTTESLLLQAIAQDMAREDEGGISVTGLTESSHEKNSGESENTPKHSLSQHTVASTRMEEVQVEKSSNEGPTLSSDGPILAPEVLQEPETQSWHISVVEDSTMIDWNNSDVTEDPNLAMLAIVEEARFTSSPPPPSMIPASIEEAPSAPREDPLMTLSQNPWANGTPRPAAPSRKARKSVAFSDHPSSSSVDDDDLDLPQQTVNLMPSSPPPRTSHPPPSQRQSPPPSKHQSPRQPVAAPIFSPPPVWQEPPSTESPFPLIINGLCRDAQHFPTQSSQGMGMANAFLAADQLAQLAPVREEREDTLSPPSKPRMAAPSRVARQQTPEPQSDAAAHKKGQSSAIKQLAAMYPSSDEEMEDYSPVKARQSRSQSRSQEQSSLTFLSQEHYTRKSSPPANTPVSRVQVSRSPSTITDPYANPWLTQQPAPPSPHPQSVNVVEEEKEDYDELPPFALGNILGMLGNDFGSSVNRAPGGGADEGVGQVADEMSDLLEAWDVDEELNKARRENRDEGRDRRSSARERVGWGRF